MARSIVSSPVDPIKDYGETIVACSARTAPPRPRFLPLFLSSSLCPCLFLSVHRRHPVPSAAGYTTAFTLTAKLSTRSYIGTMALNCDTELRSIRLFFFLFSLSFPFSFLFFHVCDTSKHFAAMTLQLHLPASYEQLCTCTPSYNVKFHFRTWKSSRRVTIQRAFVVGLTY